MNKKYLLLILLALVILIIVIISIKGTKTDTFPVSNVSDYDTINEQNNLENQTSNTSIDNTFSENIVLSTTTTNSINISNNDYTSSEDSSNTLEDQLSSQTFYATIENINEYKGKTSLIVKGLEENDINYRGNFTFSIKDNTLISDSNNENVEKDDLEVGQTILIEFTGDVLESSPAQIDVTKIIIK